MISDQVGDVTSAMPQSDEFPAKGSVEEALRFCLGYAILAPSGHNAQPWWFDVNDNIVDIGLDVSRGLAVIDPEDREGLMSVGAALLMLRVAMAHFGLSSRVGYWPEPLDPEACARVTAGYGGPIEDDLKPLFDQIVRRRTSRHVFETTALEGSLIATLTDDVAVEGGVLHTFADREDRRHLASLVSDADRRQMADHRFRRELASWLRRPGSRQTDGIHGFTTRSPLDQVALASPLWVRTFDIGERRAARDDDLVDGSPVLCVLSTRSDDRQSWLCAGQALARLQLRATLSEVSVGFLNQAVEDPETRAVLAEMLGDGSAPQLVLRLGYGPTVAPQPRRPLARSLVS